jgi:hypothetical protein
LTVWLIAYAVLGPSEESSHAVWDMGLSPTDVKAIGAGWKANMAAVKLKILQSGGFNWQMFDVNGGTNAGGCLFVLK